MGLTDHTSHIAQGRMVRTHRGKREETTLALDVCEWDQGSYSFVPQFVLQFRRKPQFVSYNAFVEPWLHLATKV